MTTLPTRFDFFAIGEALVDFISDNIVDSLAMAKKFHVFVGGQSANLAIDLALLGKNTGLAACVGDDGFGDLICEYLESVGVATDYLTRVSMYPTTVAINARQTKTPDFIIHRGADTFLDICNGLEEVICESRIVHTSAFALARQPARSTITRALRMAHENGCLVTLDPNYHPHNWPDTPEFVNDLKTACMYVDVIKPSLDDCVRLFGSGSSPAEYASSFLDWGPSVVIITMGGEGVLLASSSGPSYHITPNKVTVADVTGAGDAFWAGYLYSWLEGSPALEAVCLGQVVAEAKVGVMGPITQMPQLDELMVSARGVRYKEV